jgi:hypothetical protein
LISQSTGVKRKQSIASDVTSDAESEAESEAPPTKRMTISIANPKTIKKGAVAKKLMQSRSSSVPSPSPKGVTDINVVENHMFMSTPFFNTMAPSAAGDNTIAHDINDWARIHQRAYNGTFAAHTTFENNNCTYQPLPAASSSSSSDFFCGNDASFDFFWNHPAGINDVDFGIVPPTSYPGIVDKADHHGFSKSTDSYTSCEDSVGDENGVDDLDAGIFFPTNLQGKGASAPALHDNFIFDALA